MQNEHSAPAGRISTARAVRHHLPVVIACLALGALLGSLYAVAAPTTYTSTARVLVTPSVGNPYAPTPESVRQDELTSLETVAEVARSAEVLGTVADEDSSLTTSALARGVQVTVPANTQILEVTYSATDALSGVSTAKGCP